MQRKNQIAEKMGIAEEFLSEAISGYKEEYGFSIPFKDDVLHFEPTIVLQSQLNE